MKKRHRDFDELLRAHLAERLRDAPAEAPPAAKRIKVVVARQRVRRGRGPGLEVRFP